LAILSHLPRETGLVQPQGQLVVRFAHTSCPYSLGVTAHEAEDQPQALLACLVGGWRRP